MLYFLPAPEGMLGATEMPAGVPSAEDMLKFYCKETGIPYEALKKDWNFVLAFSWFRGAVGRQDFRDLGYKPGSLRMRHRKLTQSHLMASQSHSHDVKQVIGQGIGARFRQRQVRSGSPAHRLEHN